MLDAAITSMFIIGDAKTNNDNLLDDQRHEQQLLLVDSSDICKFKRCGRKNQNCYGATDDELIISKKYDEPFSADTVIPCSCSDPTKLRHDQEEKGYDFEVVPSICSCSSSSCSSGSSSSGTSRTSISSSCETFTFETTIPISGGNIADENIYHQPQQYRKISSLGCFCGYCHSFFQCTTQFCKKWQCSKSNFFFLVGSTLDLLSSICDLLLLSSDNTNTSRDQDVPTVENDQSEVVSSSIPNFGQLLLSIQNLFWWKECDEVTEETVILTLPVTMISKLLSSRETLSAIIALCYLLSAVYQFITPTNSNTTPNYNSKYRTDQPINNTDCYGSAQQQQKSSSNGDAVSKWQHQSCYHHTPQQENKVHDDVDDFDDYNRNSYIVNERIAMLLSNITFGIAASLELVAVLVKEFNNNYYYYTFSFWLDTASVHIYLISAVSYTLPLLLFTTTKTTAIASSYEKHNNNNKHHYKDDFSNTVSQYNMNCFEESKNILLYADLLFLIGSIIDALINCFKLLTHMETVMSYSPWVSWGTVLSCFLWFIDAIVYIAAENYGILLSSFSSHGKIQNITTSAISDKEYSENEDFMILHIEIHSNDDDNEEKSQSL